jgi:mono/diheme cytochrome c family protein
MKAQLTRFVLMLFASGCLSYSVALAQGAQGDSSKGNPADGSKVVAPSQNPAPASGDGISADAATVAKGQELYEANCKTCHAITNEVVVGPGLAGILERRTVAWLIPWIKNNNKVIKSGDAYAVALYEKYGKAQMNVFEGLSNADILSILSYIKNPPAAPGQAKIITDGTPGTDGDKTTGAGMSSEYFNIIVFGLVVVLLLVLAVLGLMTALLTKMLNDRPNLTEDDKEVVNPKFELGKIFTSRPVLTGVGILAFIVFSKVSLDNIVDIGVQQGYAPKQPIAFSHKLHAGQYEINCQYCHTTVYKAKGANIPSANICMNCHNAIKQASPEIKKIYAAIENDRPIEWVRVHNLPDLAYFNHAQHTNVGGIACQNCHGQIQTMEVVQHYSPLTMGWCIDCHRKTQVNAKDNAYYDKLLALHNQTEKGELKVVNIGGIECSKCHY